MSGDDNCMALKICIIGCGNHSTRVHGPSYIKYKSNYSDTILAACCDFDPAKAAAYQRKFGFQRYYTDMNEMLQKENPDAVCVIVPEAQIAHVAVDVMKKGYNVLLEKPPGLNREETLGLIDAAENSGVINQVAFNRRYLPLIVRLKEALQFHAGNSIQNMFYEFYRYNRTESHFETTAIHGIDAAKFIIGSNYKKVRFTYQELPRSGNNVANIALECTFENGVAAQIHFCPCTGVVLERICVNAQDQTFFLNTPIWDGLDAPGELLHIKAGNVVSRLSGTSVSDGQQLIETNGFYDENRDFFENVRHNRKSENDIKSALQSVEIAEAIKAREKSLDF